MEINYSEKTEEILNYIQEGDADSVRRLLDQHPELVDGDPNTNGGKPIVLSAMLRRKELFFLLLERGATIDNHGNMGTSLMEAAMAYEQYDIASAIIKYDIDVNRVATKDGEEKTVSRSLIEASANGSLYWVLELLAKGASVDGWDFLNHPLSAAATYGHTEVADLLLMEGANPNIQDGTRTLLDVVREEKQYNWEAIEKLLIKHGAKER